MAEAMGVEGLAASLAKEKERNAELLHTQEKLRRELNKARFQAGNLRTQLQNAEALLSSTKEGELGRAMQDENESLKLQVETLREALRQSSPSLPAPQSQSADNLPTESESQPYTEGVKRAYLEVDRLERTLEQRTSEVNRLKVQIQDLEASHQRDLASLREQREKKEAELTALRDRSEKYVVLEGELQRLHTQASEATELRERLAVVTAMKDSTEATSAMVQSKLDQAMDEMAALKEKLRAATRGRGEAQREAEEAKAKTDELQGRLARLQVEAEDREAAQERDSQRTAEIEGLRSRLADEASKHEQAIEKLRTELTQASEALHTARDEARELRQRLLACQDELESSKSEALKLQTDLTNVTLESKVANRRHVNVTRDLKSQLKRDAARLEQAKVDMTRLENALKLQAEAMLESAGLPDPLSTSQQNRPSSPTNNSQAGDKTPRKMDWGALSPLLQSFTASPGINTQQVFNFGGSPLLAPPSAVTVSSQEEPSPEQTALCSALARRLETLLSENEKVRERVAFLEKTIRLLQVDVDRKKVLLRHFAGGLRGEEGEVTVETIIEAAGREGLIEEGGDSLLGNVIQGLYHDNVRLRRDLRGLGEELSSMRRLRAPSSEADDEAFALSVSSGGIEIIEET